MSVTRVTGLQMRHLAALRAVAEEGSFIGAADVLGVSQAAISQQVASLEHAIGQPVFDRPGGPRPVRLTPAGRLLLGHAETVMSQVALAERELAELSSGSAGRVAVGTFQSASVQLLPEIVAAVRAKAPDLRIHAFELDENEEIIDLLLDGEIDVAFLAGPIVDQRLSIVDVGSDPYVVLVPRHGQLAAMAKARSFPAAALRGVPFIGQHGTEQKRHIDRGLRAAGITPQYVFVSRDNGAVQAMVRAGLGAAVLPQLAVDADDPGIIVRPLDPPIPPRTIVIAVPAGGEPSPATRRLVTIARRICRTRLSPVTR